MVKPTLNHAVTPRKNKNPWIWFFGGLGAGLTLVSLGFSAIPVTTVREIRGGKIESPELEKDFAHLSQLETKFVESPEQVARLIKRPNARVSRQKSVIRKNAVIK